MKSFIQKIRSEAKKSKKKIVLPEGTEERILKAAQYLSREKITRVILLGDRSAIEKKARSLRVKLAGIELVDPHASPLLPEFANDYYELRKSKGTSLEEATEAMRQPLSFGAMLVRKDLVDGCVAGAVHSTADVLRAGIQIIGLAEGINIVSSSFLILMPRESTIYAFADCAVVPDPTPEQLASIATATAQTYRSVVGREPFAALLSFSTRRSAKHPQVDKIHAALELIHVKSPGLKADGEMQFDATIIPEIAKTKAAGSPVAGRANVLIFPNLDAANIGYKIARYLGKAQAIGPIIQGLRKPMNDLSRGCSVDDIVNVTAICAMNISRKK